MASSSSSSSAVSTIEGRRPAEAEEDGDYIVVDEDEDDDRGPGGRTYHRNLEGGGIYTWEKDVEKTWDVFDDLGDRERGGFKDSEYERRVLKRRKQNLTKDDTCKVRKGLTRHLFVIVDMSEAMNEKDFRPNRLSVTIKLLEVFIREYFDQNPISQIGIIVTRNSIAEKITELSGNPSKHIAALKRAAAASGEASLQNALEVARMTLCHVPKYGTREVLLVFGGLSTCDPGDIFETIKALKEDSVRCSIVGLSAEVYICRTLSTQTAGTYAVATSEEHFRELLIQHTLPPATIAKTKIEASLVRMGFPLRKLKSADEVQPTLCACHQAFNVGGYICPQCTSKFCELPIDCSVCSLTLVSSPHLARSYHHLFPVPTFREKPLSQNGRCQACMRGLETGTVSFVCPRCRQYYCLDCDAYIHEALHNCPGCEMSSQSAFSSSSNGNAS